VIKRLTLMCIASTSLSACEASNLYVAHETVVGLNAQVSQDRQQGRLVLGYDRDFITLVPKSVGDDDNKDVMALLSCTELEVSGIFLTRYVDVVASGEAAKTFAGKLTDGQNFFDCHKLAPTRTVPQAPKAPQTGDEGNT
jgi:hypothetical protein